MMQMGRKKPGRQPRRSAADSAEYGEVDDVFGGEDDADDADADHDHDHAAGRPTVEVCARVV